MTIIPVLEIINLTVVYNLGTHYEVVALKDFSLSVYKGEVVVITGGNGSGKSTLLRAISGTIPIKSGKILINGTDITNWSANRRAKYLGQVYQDTMLGTCPNLTIQENFELTNINKWWMPIPYSLRLDIRQIDTIKKIGLMLEGRIANIINMLSGGQRQAIAVCLAFEIPKLILLFDEFTSALDNKTVGNVLKFTFENAVIRNTTLLLVMHNTKDIQGYNYREIILL